MDAVADGMSMAIRLKSAGCVIDAPVEYTGGGATAAAAGRRGGRKRSSALASQEDGQNAKRPNYCNTLDFGGTSVFVEHNLTDDEEQVVTESDGDDGSSLHEDSDSDSSGA